MSATFLVGVDGSEGARRAAECAAERAAGEGAKLVLAHVVDWSPYEVLTTRELEERPAEHQKEIRTAAAEILEPLATSLQRDGLEIELVVRHGHPAETICKLAEELDVTQVFTGRRGRSKLGALLFGSVAGSLVQVCPVPITVVP